MGWKQVKMPVYNSLMYVVIELDNQKHHCSLNWWLINTWKNIKKKKTQQTMMLNLINILIVSVLITVDLINCMNRCHLFMELFLCCTFTHNCYELMFSDNQIFIYFCWEQKIYEQKMKINSINFINSVKSVLHSQHLNEQKHNKIATLC